MSPLQRPLRDRWGVTQEDKHGLAKPVLAGRNATPSRLPRLGSLFFSPHHNRGEEIAYCSPSDSTKNSLPVLRFSQRTAAPLFCDLRISAEFCSTTLLCFFPLGANNRQESFSRMPYSTRRSFQERTTIRPRLSQQARRLETQRCKQRFGRCRRTSWCPAENFNTLLKSNPSFFLW